MTAMPLMLTLSRSLDGFCARAAKVAVWLIPILMLVIVSDVTLRRWFVIGSTKLQELEWHLHGALFLMTLGWAYGRGAHVRIELISERFSARLSAWVELLGCILFLVPYVYAVLAFGTDYVAYSLSYGESSSSATGLPYRFIIKGFILVGFVLLGLAAIARILEAITFLCGGEPALHTRFHGKDNGEQA